MTDVYHAHSNGPRRVNICFKGNSIIHELVQKKSGPFHYSDGHVDFVFEKYKVEEIYNLPDDPPGSVRYLITEAPDMTDKPNENVLAGIRCPECDATEPFDIDGTATFERVADDGCSEFQCMHWEDNAAIKCLSCGRCGQVDQFRDTTMERVYIGEHEVQVDDAGQEYIDLATPPKDTRADDALEILEAEEWNSDLWETVADVLRNKPTQTKEGE